jgi:hypothetical protein
LEGEIRNRVHFTVNKNIYEYKIWLGLE